MENKEKKLKYQTDKKNLSIYHETRRIKLSLLYERFDVTSQGGK